MNQLARLSNAFWMLAVGVIVLYAFFVALDAFAPGDVWVLTIVVAVLAVMLAVHFLHLRRELDREGPNEARRALNAWRERRGF